MFFYYYHYYFKHQNSTEGRILSPEFDPLRYIC